VFVLVLAACKALQGFPASHVVGWSDGCVVEAPGAFLLVGSRLALGGPPPAAFLVRQRD
jgi:hypothetical protein